MKTYACILFIIFLSGFSLYPAENIFLTTSGEVHFVSDAPLEVIKASSNELTGAVNIDKRIFLFTVKMKTFHGFNSTLQQEHFNENYMESEKFETAAFEGKIIEQIDFSSEGSYEVRAKGILNLHGVKQERIIKAIILSEKENLTVTSEFSVFLEDHNITIPRIVYQKIAPEIKVNIKAVMKKQ